MVLKDYRNIKSNRDPIYHLESSENNIKVVDAFIICHEVLISDVKNVSGFKDQNHLSKESWESFDYDPSRLYKLVEDHGKKLFFLDFQFSFFL